MTLYLCFFTEGGAYLSDTPDGDTNQPIELEAQAGEMLTHLLGLQSFVAAQALASLYLAGATAGERAVRGRQPARRSVSRPVSRTGPSGTTPAA